ASPASVSFDSQAVNTSSEPVNVVVTNNSNASLTIASISTSGDFDTPPITPTVLTPGASLSIKITFKPTVPGLRQGNVTINLAAGSPLVIPLSGAGLSANLQATPSSLFLTSVLGESALGDVTLTNNGSLPVVITEVTLGGSAASDYSL